MLKGGAKIQFLLIILLAALLVALIYFFFRPTQQEGIEPPYAARVRACENAQIADGGCYEDREWNPSALVNLPEGCGALLEKQELREITCPNSELPDYCSCGKPPV